jgi:tripartite ATP-independent transporter DctP family solute receptor
MKWKFGLVLAVIVALLVVTGCGSNTNNTSASKNEDKADEPIKSAKKITLRLSEAQGDDYPDSIAEKAFAQLVKEKSDGRITIDIYTGGQLGDEKTTIEQVQVGVIDIGRANSGPLAQFSENFGIFSFPFLFNDRDHLWRVLEGPVGTSLMDGLKQSNLIGLAFYDAGFRNFYTKKPVRKLADLDGMKLRVIQNDILIEAFKTLKVAPTPMSAAEVYSGLQTGVIDGGENNVSTYVGDGLYEVAQNYTLSKHLSIPGVLFMSKKAWDGLSSEDQQVIAEAAKESEKIQMEEFDKFQQMSTDKVIAKGNEIIELSPEVVVEIREKTKPVFDKYQDKFGQFFQEIENAKSK